MTLSKQLKAAFGTTALGLAVANSAYGQDEQHDSLLNFEALSDSEATEVQKVHEHSSGHDD